MRTNRPRGRTPAARVEVRLNDAERDLVKTLQSLAKTVTGRQPSASAVVSELVRRYGNRHLSELATRGRQPEATSLAADALSQGLQVQRRVHQ